MACNCLLPQCSRLERDPSTKRLLMRNIHRMTLPADLHTFINQSVRLIKFHMEYDDNGLFNGSVTILVPASEQQGITKLLRLNGKRVDSHILSVVELDANRPCKCDDHLGRANTTDHATQTDSIAALTANKFQAFAKKQSQQYNPHPAIARDQVGTGGLHRRGHNYVPLTTELAIASDVRLLNGDRNRRRSIPTYPVRRHERSLSPAAARRPVPVPGTRSGATPVSREGKSAISTDETPKKTNSTERRINKTAPSEHIPKRPRHSTAAESAQQVTTGQATATEARQARGRQTASTRTKMKSTKNKAATNTEQAPTNPSEPVNKRVNSKIPVSQSAVQRPATNKSMTGNKVASERPPSLPKRAEGKTSTARMIPTERLGPVIIPVLSQPPVVQSQPVLGAATGNIQPVELFQSKKLYRRTWRRPARPANRKDALDMELEEYFNSYHK
ncbi:hypothetical protein BC832DRAFT_609169 [Gaertneriomyces semiglobifer]|nr:hypothetical protein BC832DRAFT_609169 [Gaertneriomyces semiglobifer]